MPHLTQKTVALKSFHPHEYPDSLCISLRSSSLPGGIPGSCFSLCGPLHSLPMTHKILTEPPLLLNSSPGAQSVPPPFVHVHHQLLNSYSMPSFQQVASCLSSDHRSLPACFCYPVSWTITSSMRSESISSSPLLCVPLGLCLSVYICVCVCDLVIRLYIFICNYIVVIFTYI